VWWAKGRTSRRGSPPGGHLVSDEHAPVWWTLADAEGNEADVHTWRRPAEGISHILVR
jgi:hypothetical protein